MKSICIVVFSPPGLSMQYILNILQGIYSCSKKKKKKDSQHSQHVPNDESNKSKKNNQSVKKNWSTNSALHPPPPTR